MRSCILAILFVIFSASPAQARRARSVDYGYEMVRDDRFIEIFKDGSFQSTAKREVNLLNELGREQFSVYNIYYNLDNEKVTLHRAWTITNGKKQNIAEEYIEDRHLHNESGDFDARMVKSIAFNSLAPDSKIYLEYTIKTSKPPIKGHFSDVVTFGEGPLVKNKTYTYKSEIPLHLKQHDPSSNIEVLKSTKSIIVKQKTPFMNSIIDEKNNFEPWDKKTYVEVSTHTDWEETFKSLRLKVEERMTAELPAAFHPIRQKAAGLYKKKGLVPMLERLMADLRQKIRYVGDWRTMEGGYVPRELSRIAESTFGDCKDYSIVTIKILRDLGINAWFTTIERGVKYNPVKLELPTLYLHNHAVVTLENPENGEMKVIDPTNDVSYAKNVLADLAGRTTLIYKPDGVEWGKTPDSVPDDEVYSIDQVYEFGELDGMTVKNIMELKGRAAKDLTGAELFSTKENIENWLFKNFLDISKPDTWKFSPYGLKDRVVKDLTLNFTYNRDKNGMGYTNVGTYLPLPTWVVPFSLPNQDLDRKTGLYLGRIQRQERTVLLKNLRIDEINTLLNCSIETKWYEFHRSFDLTKKGVLLKESAVVKESVIPPEYLVSKQYVEDIDQLDKCGYNAGLILPFNSRETASLEPVRQ